MEIEIADDSTATSKINSGCTESIFDLTNDFWYKSDSFWVRIGYKYMTTDENSATTLLEAMIGSMASSPSLSNMQYYSDSNHNAETMTEDYSRYGYASLSTIDPDPQPEPPTPTPDPDSGDDTDGDDEPDKQDDKSGAQTLSALTGAALIAASIAF